MDFESPDVAKDFPGLYASEVGRRSNESDLSDGGDQDKPIKKVLGLRKDKGEKKDRGYAALAGESSPEEETEAKSPTKSKKTKSFKFPSTSKNKDKREKSRDKEKTLEREIKEKDLDKEKKKDKEHEKDKKKEKDKKEKKEKSKDKEKEEKVKIKEKDKSKDKEKDKSKDKEKEKKDKKLCKVPSTVTSGVPFEEIFTIGVALPIFGVNLQVSAERMRCHDDVGLPLIVRDCIDYLQIHGLNSSQIYRAEADKIKLQQLRKLYDDRVGHYPYHWDVPVACSLLKTFLSELSEPILTHELCQCFEQAMSLPETKRIAAVSLLIQKLPLINQTLVGWLMTHLNDVIKNESVNQVNIQTLWSYFGNSLKMSNGVFIYLVNEAKKLFPNLTMEKYIPPLPSIPNDFPDDDVASISRELRKQESLLSQIHAEMHAGFTTTAREELLWEGQRIVTQLKRKLRMVQKSSEPMSLSMQQSSIEEKPPSDNTKASGPQAETQVVVQATSAVVQAPPSAVPIPPSAVPIPPSAVPIPPSAVPIPPSAVPIPQSAVPITSAAVQAPPPVVQVLPQAIAQVPTQMVVQPHTQVTSPLIVAPATSYSQEIDPVILEPDFEAAFPPSATPPNAGVKETFEDNFEPGKTTEDQVDNKQKLSDLELQLLRLRLENAEFLQLKALLQAKINSEKFEIVKLKSQMAIKSKLEGNQSKCASVALDDEDLRMRLRKENAILEQKRQSLINEVFHERCACVQLKIDLAMKEIL